jgi:hypothetical protein
LDEWERERKSQSLGRNKISRSDTDHGKAIYDSLERDHSIKIYDDTGPAIFPEELVQSAENLYNTPKRPNEQSLVNTYTPALMEALEEVNPHLRLVNSECYAWLRCVSGHRPSPDLFSAHHSLVEFSPPYLNAPECLRKRLFGRFVSWESRSSINCIWDAKWKINMTAFGATCMYLQIAGEDHLDYDGVPVRLRGILFDVHEFWMIKSCGSAIVNVVKCRWTQQGSKKCLLEFLNVCDPWLEAGSALCEQLGVQIKDFSDSDHEEKPSAFLGAGAYGRIFKLATGGVMKVVVGRGSELLEREYAFMLEYQSRTDTRPFIFPLVVDSFRSGEVYNFSYAGYLLAEEGKKIALPLTTTLKDMLVVSLYGLHSRNVIHGDPHIDNALLLGDSLKWIDFRDSVSVTTKIDRRRDVTILYKSLGGLEVNARGEIDAYRDSPSVERLHSILSLV